jgi:hypothetical protein
MGRSGQIVAEFVERSVDREFSSFRWSDQHVNEANMEKTAAPPA